MSHSRIPQFYKFSVADRLRALLEREVISEIEYDALMDGTHLLDADTADRLIENVISVFGLPMGLGLNFQINGRDYLVPMVVEEPSIIAAVSSAAKIVREQHSAMLDAMVQDHERATGQWHVEWHALPTAFIVASGGLAAAAEVLEGLVIGQDWDDDVRVVLFIRLAEGVSLDDALTKKIKDTVRKGASPRHVPAKIIAVADIPRTKSGKIVELAVRNVVHGRPVKNVEALANPEALKLYENRPELAG